MGSGGELLRKFTGPTNREVPTINDLPGVADQRGYRLGGGLLRGGSCQDGQADHQRRHDGQRPPSRPMRSSSFCARMDGRGAPRVQAPSQGLMQAFASPRIDRPLSSPRFRILKHSTKRLGLIGGPRYLRLASSLNIDVHGKEHGQEANSQCGPQPDRQTPCSSCEVSAPDTEVGGCVVVAVGSGAGVGDGVAVGGWSVPGRRARDQTIHGLSRRFDMVKF